MKFWLAMAIVPFSLGGCGVDEWVSRTNAAQFRRQCVDLGFVPGTDPFSNCMLQQSAQREQQNQAIQDRVHLDRAVDKLKSP